MSSSYPPGFGSPNDWDHVEGPLTEEEFDELCPECHEANVLWRTTWRSRSPSIDCENCDYHRDEEA